jgi:uncharacterized phage protein (TIGR01671 family)
VRNPSFRAWDDKNKTFPFEGFHVMGECTAFNLLEQYRLEEWDDIIIEQWTELKDKNGKKIYEGDIVLCYPDNKAKSLIEDNIYIVRDDLPPLPQLDVVLFKGVVEYHAPRFVLKTIGHPTIATTNFEHYTLEVIGNIHEKTLDGTANKIKDK